MTDVDMIKQDPEEDMEQRLLGDDDYEDTGELELPANAPNAYLMRIPKILYENWKNIGNDEDIQIGVLRRYTNGSEHRILLDPQIPQNQKVPKEYVVQMVNDDLKNTFYFTEKDLPGFKGRTKSAAKQGDKSNGLGVAQGSGVEKRRSNYRKAIPKQTALTAIAKKEATAVAVENAEYHTLMKERQEAADKINKQNITLLGGDPRMYAQSILPTHATGKTNSGFDTFVKNTPNVGKVKPQENKAARMPRNELLDRLYDCFKLYNYWSMNALKQELRQPEAYLKEVLNSIAELVRSGQFSGQYTLRPEARESNLQAAAKDEQAPEDETMLDDDAIADDVPGADEDSGDNGDEDLQIDDP